jgi:hypothetical protein
MRQRGEPGDEPATDPDLEPTCAVSGRVFLSDGLPPARDGNAWICAAYMDIAELA